MGTELGAASADALVAIAQAVADDPNRNALDTLREIRKAVGDHPQQEGMNGQTQADRVQDLDRAIRYLESISRPTAGDWLIRIGLVIPLLHVVVYVVLFAGAPRSSKCFAALTSSGWLKHWVYPHLLIRFSNTVQLFLFQKYFRTQQRTLPEPDPYHPISLEGESGESVASNQILDVLKQTSRLWIQGNAGMGKTTLIKQQRRQYFYEGEGSSLWTAYRRHGFVPIFVDLRGQSDVSPSDKQQRWVVAAAQAALDEAGVHFKDFGLLQAVLEGGVFALVLDGLNETDLAEKLWAARRIPKMRLLITSQEAGGAGFNVLRLPRDVTCFVKQLLMLWLGEEQGAAVFTHIKDSGLTKVIRSGYDVRLVADLAQRVWARAR